VATLQAGESVDAVVDYDTLEIDGEALEMARVQGRHTLGPNELAYKRASLAVLKQSAVAGIEDLTVLKEWRKTPRLDLFETLDSDDDGVLHPFDNCLDDKNPSPDQNCDADNDGIGNFCDCDLNQSGACTNADIPPMKAAVQNNDPVGDINCSGAATTADLPLFKAILQRPNAPGPSGLPCAYDPGTPCIP